jgi:predicted transcriptional regulator
VTAVEAFSKKLRTWMQDNGETVSGLSRLSGLPYNTIKGILNGKSGRLENIETLAQVTGISIRIEKVE